MNIENGPWRLLDEGCPLTDRVRDAFIKAIPPLSVVVNIKHIQTIGNPPQAVTVNGGIYDEENPVPFVKVVYKETPASDDQIEETWHINEVIPVCYSLHSNNHHGAP